MRSERHLPVHPLMPDCMKLNIHVGLHWKYIY